MSSTAPASLLDSKILAIALERLLGREAPWRLVVALSGGADSAVLLAIAAELAAGSPGAGQIIDQRSADDRRAKEHHADQGRDQFLSQLKEAGAAAADEGQQRQGDAGQHEDRHRVDPTLAGKLHQTPDHRRGGRGDQSANLS